MGNCIGKSQPQEEKILSKSAESPILARPAPSKTPHGVPDLVYPPMAARGELVRMLAALGGLAITETSVPMGGADPAMLAACGSPSGLPILTHGKVNLSQSLAIESYISSIAPKFSNLGQKARARDLHYSGIKDDLMSEIAKQLFGAKDPEMIKGAFKKWFSVLEHIVPSDGFVNGLTFPTLADFACLLMVTGQTPYLGASNMVGLVQGGLANYPKLAALVARIKAVPEVAAYLERSTTMTGNPFGLPTSCMPPPNLVYPPMAARGELVRMLAALGGLELTETSVPMGGADPAMLAACGSPSGLPILTHGKVNLSQSLAIESYIASIAPKYANLAPKSRARDLHYSGIKDDLMSEIAKQLFGDKDPEMIKGSFKKWFSVLEVIAPASGFVNGLPFPTLADFSCLLMADGQTPYSGASKMVGLVQGGLADYPKLAALVARVKAVPEVAAYLKKSTTMTGNPFGLPE